MDDRTEMFNSFVIQIRGLVVGFVGCLVLFLLKREMSTFVGL